MEIKRKVDGEKWTFFADLPREPGRLPAYVFTDRGLPGHEGTLGWQICKGGGFVGVCVDAATEKEFLRAVNAWVSAYRKAGR